MEKRGREEGEAKGGKVLSLRWCGSEMTSERLGVCAEHSGTRPLRPTFLRALVQQSTDNARRRLPCPLHDSLRTMPMYGAPLSTGCLPRLPFRLCALSSQSPLGELNFLLHGLRCIVHSGLQRTSEEHSHRCDTRLCWQPCADGAAAKHSRTCWGRAGSCLLRLPGCAAEGACSSMLLVAQSDFCSGRGRDGHTVE